LSPSSHRPAKMILHAAQPAGERRIFCLLDHWTD
jgi:hypothetical protein